jgi:hypothetical protein
VALAPPRTAKSRAGGRAEGLHSLLPWGSRYSSGKFLESERKNCILVNFRFLFE